MPINITIKPFQKDIDQQTIEINNNPEKRLSIDEIMQEAKQLITDKPHLCKEILSRISPKWKSNETLNDLAQKLLATFAKKQLLENGSLEEDMTIFSKDGERVTVNRKLFFFAAGVEEASLNGKYSKIIVH